MGLKTAAAYEEIKRMVSGELRPGSRFPSERELVKRLGITRTTVRQILSRLVLEGLLEVRDRSGYFVPESASLKLARVSEYRLVYWTDRKSRFLTVSRDRDERSDKWAIFDGAFAWDGEDWTEPWEVAAPHQWELEEALAIAERLALEWNQKLVEQMEGRFPGEFRGSKYDLVAERERG